MVTLLPVDEVLQEGHCFRLSWYTKDHSIILLEIFDAWTWDDAMRFIPNLNKLIEAQTHPVYSLYYYHVSHASLFPKGFAGTSNLRRLVEMDPPNEALVIFIRQDMLTRQFISIVTRTFRLNRSKYRFVATLEDALALVEKHISNQQDE